VEYWWKENKGYAIAVGVGVVAIAVWYFYVAGGLATQSARLQSARVAAEQALDRQMAAGVPSEDVVGRAKRDVERANKLLADLRGEMCLRMTDSADAKKQIEFSAAYKPPGGKGPADFFVSHKEEVRKKIQDAAATAGVGLPNEPLGFPTQPEGMPDEVGVEWLARLSIVERLALGAIQAGITKIDSVVAVVAPDIDTAVVRKGMFVNRLTVRMKIFGPSKAVFEWLHGVQKKSDFLAVDEFKTVKENPHEDVFSAEMDVSGLIIDPNGSLVEVKEKE